MSAFPKIGLGNEKYPALTGVRAIGASVVFFDHFPLWPSAHLTVNVMAFFYVLSGFLIVRIYYEQAQLRLDWLAKYFVNRFARIYPVYFLLLTLAVCLQHDFQPWLLIKNYTLTHALFHGTTLIIQPSWSLTVEECFYFLAPLFMLLTRRYNFFVPFALGWLLLLAALVVSRLGTSFLGTPGFVISSTFFGHFVEFFAGVYLALVVMRLETSGSSLHVPSRRRTLAGLAGVSLLVIAMVIVYRHTPLNYAAIVLINNFLIPVPIALLYWGLLREQTAVARFLCTNTCGLLGRSSYSFYLLHTLIIDYIGIPLLPLSGHRSLCVVLTFLVSWLVSVLLFAFYEEPVNLFIRRRFKSKERWVGMQATLFQVPPQAPTGSG